MASQETLLTEEQARELQEAMREAVNSVPMGLRDSRERKQEEEEQQNAA